MGSRALAVGCGVRGVEHACGYPASSSYLFGGRLGPDTCDDPDQSHGEESRQLVEIDARVEVTGLPTVVQCVAERLGESVQVGGNVASGAGVQRCSFDCGVAQ